MAYNTNTLGGGAGKTRTAAPGRLNSNIAYSWGDLMTGMRPTTNNTVAKGETVVALEVKFRVWKEMIEEPSKYGDDIVEWLALDEELRASRKSWKIERYWLNKEADQAEAIAAEQAKWRAAFAPIATQAAVVGARRWVEHDIKRCIKMFRGSVVKIQAAVRGHQARLQTPVRDCCMCLAHRISPLKTAVGLMCRECAAEGPHVDHMGPLTDPWDWFRADYEEENPCRWCRAPTENGAAFCDAECKIDYERKGWKY